MELPNNLDVIGFEDRIVTYTVVGGTIEEIDRSMSERTIAPHGFYAYTLHHNSMGFFRNKRGVLLAYQIVVIKPDWNRKGARREVEVEWNRFMRATDIHERGHIKIYSAAYKRIKQIADVGRIDPILGLAQNNTDRYDTATDHGALQGARIGSKVTPQDFTGLVDSLAAEISQA
jgi:hypothetical protein